jgi:hypothetical protein
VNAGLVPCGQDVGMTGPTSPLAYVFWHSPSSPSPAYVADLLAFHASLAARPPAGFVRSETFGLAGASWLVAAGDGYEDWYLASDWAAIGELNHDAVAAAHVTSHDRVAHYAGSGAGAVYGLQAGSAGAGLGAAAWFAKPPGWSYEQLDDVLAGAVDAGRSLWRRQLVLGPAPEFCLRAERPFDLPDGIGAEWIDYRLLP